MQTHRIINRVVLAVIIGAVCQTCAVPSGADQKEETKPTPDNTVEVTPQNFWSFEMKTVDDTEWKILSIDVTGKTTLEIQRPNANPLKLEMMQSPAYLLILSKVLNKNEFLKLAGDLANRPTKNIPGKTPPDKTPAHKAIAKETLTLTLRELKRPFFISDNGQPVSSGFRDVANFLKYTLLRPLCSGRALATAMPLVTRENFRWMKITTVNTMTQVQRGSETLITDGYALHTRTRHGNRLAEEQDSHTVSGEVMKYYIEALNGKPQSRVNVSPTNLEGMEVTVQIGLRDAQGIYPPFLLPASLARIVAQAPDREEPPGK